MIDGLASEFPSIGVARAARAISGGDAGVMLDCDYPVPGCDNYGDPVDPPPGGGGGGEQVCDRPAPGCVETVPEMPPDPYPYPDYSEIPAPAPSPPVVCEISTDYPHRSTTSGFGGNINVKSKTGCSAPASLMVQATLKRESCFLWIFCSWSTIAQSLPFTNPSGLQVFAPATSDCAWQDGWYRGIGNHSVTYQGQTRGGETGTVGVRIRCW